MDRANRQGRKFDPPSHPSRHILRYNLPKCVLGDLSVLMLCIVHITDYVTPFGVGPAGHGAYRTRTPHERNHALHVPTLRPITVYFKIPLSKNGSGANAPVWKLPAYHVIPCFRFSGREDISPDSPPFTACPKLPWLPIAAAAGARRTVVKTAPQQCPSERAHDQGHAAACTAAPTHQRWPQGPLCQARYGGCQCARPSEQLGRRPSSCSGEQSSKRPNQGPSRRAHDQGQATACTAVPTRQRRPQGPLCWAWHGIRQWSWPSEHPGHHLSSVNFSRCRWSRCRCSPPRPRWRWCPVPSAVFGDRQPSATPPWLPKQTPPGCRAQEPLRPAPPPRLAPPALRLPAPQWLPRPNGATPRGPTPDPRSFVGAQTLVGGGPRGVAPRTSSSTPAGHSQNDIDMGGIVHFTWGKLT
eukprot:SAG31_NODE_1758_length_7335_cov_18.704600_5_plen_412_part_00